MNAEILAIGDEITSGQLLDTNSQWLSRRLQDLGVRALSCDRRRRVAPSADVFAQAIQRSDVVVATGGLGPTADDLTREALAWQPSRPLVAFSRGPGAHPQPVCPAEAGDAPAKRDAGPVSRRGAA